MPPTDAHVIADRLHSAAIRLLRLLRKQDDASGLSAPRLSALSVIVFGGPITLGELARAEQVRPPTMTRLVQGLERDGLVQRSSDPTDKRVTVLEATARGTSVLQKGRERRIELLASLVAQLSVEQKVLLRDAADLIEQVSRSAPPQS